MENYRIFTTVDDTTLDNIKKGGSLGYINKEDDLHSYASDLGWEGANWCIAIKDGVELKKAWNTFKGSNLLEITGISDYFKVSEELMTNLKAVNWKEKDVDLIYKMKDHNKKVSEFIDNNLVLAVERLIMPKITLGNIKEVFNMR